MLGFTVVDTTAAALGPGTKMEPGEPKGGEFLRIFGTKPVAIFIDSVGVGALLGVVPAAIIEDPLRLLLRGVDLNADASYVQNCFMLSP